MKIIAIDRKGKEQTLEGRDGWSVMEILRDGGMDIAAECGGACACATCHVYVKDGWSEKPPPPSDGEIDMLDMALAVEPTSSRLSCQIICSETTDGIKVSGRAGVAGIVSGRPPLQLLRASGQLIRRIAKTLHGRTVHSDSESERLGRERPMPRPGQFRCRSIFISLIAPGQGRQ